MTDEPDNVASETDSTPARKSRMSVEQVEALIEDLALNGDPASRRWALGKLRASHEEEPTLPPPLDEREIVARLSRLMHGAGRTVSAAAWRLAWPSSRLPVEQQVVAEVKRAGGEHLPARIIEKIARIRDVPSLFREIPELKAPGRMPGFPIDDGPVARAEACRKRATAYYVDLMRRGELEMLAGGPRDEHAADATPISSGVTASAAATAAPAEPAAPHLQQAFLRPDEPWRDPATM